MQLCTGFHQNIADYIDIYNRTIKTNIGVNWDSDNWNIYIPIFNNIHLPTIKQFTTMISI
jgi:hypothetical protein